MWNLKKKLVQMTLFTKQRYPPRKQTSGYRGKREGGINRETKSDVCPLPYVKMMTSEGLLYGSGNSIQCSVVTSMGEKPKKEWICEYV